MARAVGALARPSATAFRTVLGSALGALGIGLTFVGMDLALLQDALGRAQLGWLALAGLSVAATLLVKALRWGALFPPAPGRAPIGPIVVSYLLGQLANAVLPVRSGEVVRAAHLSRLAGPTFGAAVGTIVAEKLVDAVVAFGLGVALVGLGVGAQLAMPSAGSPLSLLWDRALIIALQSVGSVLPELGLIATLAALALAVPSSRRLLRDLVGRLPGRLPRPVRQQIAAGVAVFAAFGDARPWAVLVGSSAVVWTLMAATNALVFLALDLHLPIMAAPVLLLTLQSAAAVPSSIGRPGVFLFVTAATLGQFGVDSASGVAAGLLLFAVVFLPPIVGGALVLPTSMGATVWRWQKAR